MYVCGQGVTHVGTTDYNCYRQQAEEVVHASLSVTAMLRVQQNLLFSSTYLQPIFNLLGVMMEHFKSLLLAFGKVCDAF